MKYLIHKTSTFLTLIVLTVILAMTSGCSYFNNSSDDEMAPLGLTQEDMGPQPFYPSNFLDIPIPGELKFDRENSMSIKTASFAGGILTFKGRVEVNSLTDFFVSSMKNNGWELVGTINYKSVLLAFVKPNQTCMIKIEENRFHTVTQIYITKDISKSAERNNRFNNAQSAYGSKGKGGIITETLR